MNEDSKKNFKIHLQMLYVLNTLILLNGALIQHYMVITRDYWFMHMNVQSRILKRNPTFLITYNKLIRIYWYLKTKYFCYWLTIGLRPIQTSDFRGQFHIKLLHLLEHYNFSFCIKCTSLFQNWPLKSEVYTFGQIWNPQISGKTWHASLNLKKIKFT
jgi:hypothetical protein